MEYKRNFSLYDAYDFLTKNGLELESTEIRASADKFKSYTSTLRRAKIIVLVKSKGLLEKFCSSVWPSGATDKGKARVKFFVNLVTRYNADQEGTTNEEDEEDVVCEENEFAYENDLRNFLVKNLSRVEGGLKIYEGPDKISGEEFYIPSTSRRIDILAKDKNDNYVVIELKVSRGYERVVGQTLYYQSMIRTIFNQPTVRAIIVAREITPELRAATKFLPDFELFEYQLSINLTKVQ